MNRILLCFAILVIACARLHADPEIPASAWEQHPEGVAVAMIFSNQNVNATQASTITVFMKNTSGSNTYFLGTEGFHMVVALFTINKAGAEIPLRDYSPQAGSKIEAPEIKPGEILTRLVQLTPQEQILVKDRPIKCSLRFMNVVDKERHFYTVQSTPKVLVTTQ